MPGCAGAFGRCGGALWPGALSAVKAEAGGKGAGQHCPAPGFCLEPVFRFLANSPSSGVAGELVARAIAIGFRYPTRGSTLCTGAGADVLKDLFVGLRVGLGQYDFRGRFQPCTVDGVFNGGQHDRFAGEAVCIVIASREPGPLGTCLR